MVTGINFSTGNVFSEVYLNDNRIGNHKTDISIAAGTYNFEMRAAGCDPIKLNDIVVIDGQVTRIGSTDSRMKFVRFWTPPDESVWNMVSRSDVNMSSCENYNSEDVTYWLGGVAHVGSTTYSCSCSWSPVINIAHSKFDARIATIRSSVQLFVDAQTKIAVDSINSASGSNLLSKLKETIAWYKSVVIGDSSGSWEFSKPLLNSYETQMNVATAEWQWWLSGCYRDCFIVVGDGKAGGFNPTRYFYFVDPSAQKTFDDAVAVLQSKLDTFGTWLFDIVQVACDKVATALSTKYNTAIVTEINTYVDSVTLPTGFVDSQNLRSGFIDAKTELDKKLNEYSKTLSDMFNISAATTSKFASSRITAVARLDARINNRPIIRLTGKRTNPVTINWSGTNRFGVEVNNIGGASFKGFFGYRFIDLNNNEYVYNTAPGVIPTVASGETVMLNTDIPFDKLFPAGSVGKLRVKLIPIRSGT